MNMTATLLAERIVEQTSGRLEVEWVEKTKDYVDVTFASSLTLTVKESLRTQRGEFTVILYDGPNPVTGSTISILKAVEVAPEVIHPITIAVAVQVQSTLTNKTITEPDPA